MLEIERRSMFKARYEVRDDQGHVSTWHGPSFGGGASAEIDGVRYEIRREGRRRFVLTQAGSECASAERSGRRWEVLVDGERYELRRPSPFGSAMELCCQELTVGSVRRATLRSKVRCELPPELSPPVQAFIGFVATALWRREEDATSAGVTGAVAGSS